MAELKTYSEALGSFTTERIRSQMWRCRQHADIPILLLYGYFSPTTEGFCQVRGTYKGESYSTVYIQYSAFRNFLAHLNTVGIITDEISRRDFTAKRLKALWGWTQNLDEESLTPGIQLPQVADKGEFMALRKLMVVDGWGQELASRMLALYGNSPWEAMKELMDGDEKQVLKKLKGLGVGKKKLAQLRKEWANAAGDPRTHERATGPPVHADGSVGLEEIRPQPQQSVGKPSVPARDPADRPGKPSIRRTENREQVGCARRPPEGYALHANAAPDARRGMRGGIHHP